MSNKINVITPKSINNKSFLFSIIVPVYNTEKYVEKCLNSIQKAMDTDCEVIIVNDGATDNSDSIIKEYINKLPDKYKENFVYVTKENKGLADTKNVGISLARGKFISVVDSDDYISDDFYTIARKYINEYEIIIYDLYIIFEKNNLWNYTSRARRDDKEDFLDGLLSGAMSGSSCNKIIKKELYKGFEFPVGKQYEDTAVTPFILTNANKIKYVPYPMYYYLQREKSIVATNTYMSAFYKICSNITDVIKEHGSIYDKYKYVINEFFVKRTLDIFEQDLYKNKKEFLNNIKDFAQKNKETIEYIIKQDFVNTVANEYSPRQKKIVTDMYIALANGECKKVKRVLTQRKVINYLRNIKNSFVKFAKSIINR